MHIAVIDEDGSITGTAGEILETFEGVSQAHDAKDASNNSNYYADVIYRNSKFIYWIDHISTLSDGLGKTGQTFDNTVGDAFVISNTSLSLVEQMTTLLLTLRLQLHMKNLMT